MAGIRLTYWVFHALFTLPQIFLLRQVLRPILSSRDLFRIVFVASLATLYAFPWDRHVIVNGVWGYPSWAVLFTVGNVPIEEIAYFSLQSVLSAYLYTLFTVPILPALCAVPRPGSLERRAPVVWWIIRWTPFVGFVSLAVYAWRNCRAGAHSFYLAILVAWASPVCALLWALAGDHILRRPKSIIATVALSTVYLSVTDTIAMRNQIWSISESTSTGIFVWKDLPLEEALFFLMTNLMVVFGMAGFEKYEAIIDTWPELFYRRSPSDLRGSTWPCSLVTGPVTPIEAMSIREKFRVLFKALFISFRLPRVLRRNYTPAGAARVSHLARTLAILSRASKSFYTASFIFPNFQAIRAKFIILYGFCRETDDLIDKAPNEQEARQIVAICKEFLDVLWSGSEKRRDDGDDDDDDDELDRQIRTERFINTRVPDRSRPVFMIFMTLRKILKREPFDELISGYEYDSINYAKNEIGNEDDLLRYCRWVAGSVGEMCVWIMWSVYGAPDGEAEQRSILRAANDMGVALQLINIARDIREDATMGRIYLPKVWFEKEIIDGVGMKDFEKLRSKGNDIEARLDEFPYDLVACKLLNLSREYQSFSQCWIKKLPKPFQPGIRAATQVYLKIGEEIQKRIDETAKERKLKGMVMRTGEKDCAALGGQSWKGQRVFMTPENRTKIVARELWNL